MEFKEDTHNEGHTMRHRGFWPGKQAVLKRQPSKVAGGEYVTDIDELVSVKRFVDGYHPVPFNSPAMWEDVETELESLAKHKKTVLNYVGNLETVYSVPASEFIEYEQIGAINDNDNKQKDAKWNGQFYDRNFIYEYTGNDSDMEGTLTKVCPIYSQAPVFDVPDTKQIAAGIIKPEAYANFELHGPVRRSQFTRERADYIEFDLTTNTQLSHIGTFGRYPSTRSFPQKVRSKGMPHNRQWRKKQFGLLQVCNSRDPMYYVMSYKVLYQGADKKWHSLGTFGGNKDIGTEQINRVDIFTRYIRIKPLTYRGEHPSMRIVLYGPVSEKTDEDKQKAIASELIEYTIEHVSESDYVPDGKGCGKYRCDCMSCRRGARHPARQTTKQYMDEMVYDDGSDYYSDDSE